MGHCCAREGKPVITSDALTEAQLVQQSNEIRTLSQILKRKRETMRDLQQSLRSFQKNIELKQSQVTDVSKSVTDNVESAQAIYDACVRLITRISILQTIAKNMRSDEFKPLLVTQTIDSAVLSLLSSSEIPVGRQTHSLILAEIRGTTIDSSDTDIDAIKQLKGLKEKAEELGKALSDSVINRDRITHDLATLDSNRLELFKNSNLFSNDLLFFKDRRQEFLVKCSVYDEEIRKVTKGLSPVALIQDLFALESEDFALAAEVSGLNSSIRYCEMHLKSSESKEDRAGKLIVRIAQIPVPLPIPRPSVTVLGIAPKIVDEESDVDILEDEIAEQRAQAMYEEVQSLEARLEEARDSFRMSQRMSLKMEEQIEFNEFNKAELVLKLIATRLVHRVKLERIWLFSEWRLSCIEGRPDHRSSKKLILG